MAISVAYSTFMILLPTSVVVRNVSGFSLKKASEREINEPFRLSISSFNRFAETNAISEPEKNALANTVSMMIGTSKSCYRPLNIYLMNIKNEDINKF